MRRISRILLTSVFVAGFAGATLAGENAAKDGGGEAAAADKTITAPASKGESKSSPDRQDTETAVTRIVSRLDPDRPTVNVETSAPVSVTVNVDNAPRRVLVDYRHAIDMTVYFAYDSTHLTETGRFELDKLGAALMTDDLRPHSYLIAGHTDARGSAAYNRALSRRRARAVRDYLIDEWNVDPNRLRVHGWGESRLKDPSHPRSGVNRRVEVAVIVADAGPVATIYRDSGLYIDGRRVSMVGGDVTVRVDVDGPLAGRGHVRHSHGTCVSDCRVVVDRPAVVVDPGYRHVHRHGTVHSHYYAHGATSADAAAANRALRSVNGTYVGCGTCGPCGVWRAHPAVMDLDDFGGHSMPLAMSPGCGAVVTHQVVAPARVRVDVR